MRFFHVMPLMLLLSAASSRTVAAPLPPAPDPTPGRALGTHGFLNPAKTIVVFTGPDSTCEAVDIATGKTLWKQADAPIVVAVLGERVLVVKKVEGKDNPVRVVAVNAATGKSVLESAVFAFRAQATVGFAIRPPQPMREHEMSWSPVSVSGGLSRYDFYMHPHWIAKEERLILVWTAGYTKLGGALEPPAPQGVRSM